MLSGIKRIHRFLLPDDPNIGWMPYMWLIFLSSFIAGIAQEGSGPLELSLSVAAVFVFLALYFRAFWFEGTRLLVFIAAITLLAIVFLPVNYGALAFFIYAASFAGMVGPPRHGAMVVAAIVVVILVEAALISPPSAVSIGALVFTVLIGTVNIYYCENARKNAALRLSQQEIERLAVTAERERIARDLHDLLGHTLSVITLKSELAGRVIDTDLERAAAEIREIETISRRALKEVRAAVTGYRTGLSTEIANARRALETADIDFAYELDSDELPKPVEDVFSMVLREGVTNVVRHSEARRCTFRVQRDESRWTMDLADDGRGSVEQENSGLAGLRERLSSIGGSLEINEIDGFTLHAEAPA